MPIDARDMGMKGLRRLGPASAGPGQLRPTHFTADPRPLLAQRDRIARMIEQLQRVAKANR